MILHDPENHIDFHKSFSSSFERLDFLTGKDFLFLGLADSPKGWLERNDRDYFGIWEVEKLLSPSNAYVTNDASISAYTITQSLNIEFDDLPVIILTNNLQFNQYQVIKTCPIYLEKQMTEIGYFCSQKSTYFNLINDEDFVNLIKSIDLCGGSFLINNEESLAKILSDFLAFVVNKNRNTFDNKNAEIQMRKVIDKLFVKLNLPRDPKRIEQLNLFLVGCLSNLKRQRISDFLLDIDERCENESKIILKTFKKAIPLFDPLNNEMSHFLYLANKGAKSEQYNYEKNTELDYSPLIMCLCKIFEIEMNLSLVHWIRNSLNIEMPKYFKKRKDNLLSYTLLPSTELVTNPRPIDFNNGNGEKWIAPGIGESELIVKTLYNRKTFPTDIHNYRLLFENWSILRRYRNEAVHTKNLDKNDFQNVFVNFNSIIYHHFS